MKKLGKAVLCTALAGAMAMSAAGAADLGSLSPKGAKAYLDQITTLQNQYGKTYTTRDHLLQGFCMAKLVDMDGDNIPELYCGSSSQTMSRMKQFLYTYDNGTLIPLSIPEYASNFSGDPNPCVLFYSNKNGAYLVDGQEIMSGDPVTFLTKQGNEIVTVFTLTNGYNDEFEQYMCSVNGEFVTQDELDTAVDNFTAGMSRQYYTYRESLHGLSGILSPRAALQDTITSLRKLTNPTAKVSTHKVTLNGAKADLAAYTINGNNYFKLRDLAKALKGLDSEFEVTWNAAQQRIDLTSKTAYTPVGGEQAALPSGNKAATLTNASVYLDGKPLDLTAYSIGGNNYFKLRDLGDALGFTVGWDSNSMTVTISAN